jgi:prephenate dehydrogenase
MQLGNEMPPTVVKAKLDKAFKKPVETLTLSEAKKIHADLFEINASVYFDNLDVAALMQLHHGSDITSGAQLHEKLTRIKDAIEVRFNL